MTHESQPSTQATKSNQYRNGMIVSGILLLIVSGVVYFMQQSDADDLAKQKIDSASFSEPVQNLHPEIVWREQIQNKLKAQEAKTNELTNVVKTIKTPDQLASVESDPRYQEMVKQNQLLKEELKTKISSSTQEIDNREGYQGRVFSTAPGARVNSHAVNSAANEPVGIDNDELNLKYNVATPKKNPDTFVPSGTFAEAIMLGAADASAGVQAQSNPSPMLFRIVANGTLPNHKKSHLKDCVVTAAVVGDISSERGQIRLERMSCTFPNGEIVEQAVEGTIFGMDAKNGVRGNPVWREGALLGRAAVAGTLSGLGSAVAQSYTTTSVSPLGSTQSVHGGDMMKFGAAQGASNAMEKLADYNIRRAEQYHPVIQLSAGQPVDVVFLKGFYLDGKNHDETEEVNKEPTALFSTSTQTTPSGLTLTERELEKIKQHETSLGWAGSNRSGEMQ